MNFIQKAGMVLGATIMAKALLLLVHILSGRYLGEAAYGYFNLVLSIASILILVSMLGLAIAARKFIPKSKDKAKTLSTILWMVVLWSIPIFGVFYLISDKLFSILHIPLSLIIPVILIAGFDNFRELSESFLYGMSNIKAISKNILLAHSLAFILFILLLIYSDIGYLTLLITYLGLYVLVGLLSLRYWVKYIGFPDKKQTKEIGFFGISCVVCSITGSILFSIDKIMVNYFLGVEGVGLYSAYFMASTVPISVLLVAFNKVLFSHVAESKEQLIESYKKFKSYLKLSLLLIPCFGLGTIILIKFYSFELDKMLVLLFSVFAVLALIEGIMMVFVYNIDNKAVWWLSLVFLIAIGVNIFLNWKLIPLYGLVGAIIATTINMLIPILYGFGYIEGSFK